MTAPTRIELPIFATGEMMTIEITETLFHGHSPYQEITVVDTPAFGRCLIIDDIMQCSEADHHLYDEAILRCLRPDDRRVLLLGSGDGYVAETAFHRNPGLTIDMVEIDPLVIDCAQRYLDQKVFADTRLYLQIGDGVEYLRQHVALAKPRYDGLVCDFTGKPITEDEQDEFVRLYRDIIEMAEQAVIPDGWVAFQAGDYVCTKAYVDSLSLLQSLLNERFDRVTRTDVMVPSYGELDTFLFGWNLVG